MQTWIVRGPASEEGLDYANDTIDAQFEVLTTRIKVCEMVADEAAPHPSCIGG